MCPGGYLCYLPWFTVLSCVIRQCCYLPPIVYCVILCVIMVDVSLGTLSIPSVLCYQCCRVLSRVIVRYHGVDVSLGSVTHQLSSPEFA